MDLNSMILKSLKNILFAVAVCAGVYHSKKRIDRDARIRLGLGNREADCD